MFIKVVLVITKHAWQNNQCLMWKRPPLGLHQTLQRGLFDSCIATETQDLLTPSLVPQSTSSHIEARLWDAVFPHLDPFSDLADRTDSPLAEQCVLMRTCGKEFFCRVCSQLLSYSPWLLLSGMKGEGSKQQEGPATGWRHDSIFSASPFAGPQAVHPFQKPWSVCTLYVYVYSKSHGLQKPWSTYTHKVLINTDFSFTLLKEAQV